MSRVIPANAPLPLVSSGASRWVASGRSAGKGFAEALSRASTSLRTPANAGQFKAAAIGRRSALLQKSAVRLESAVKLGSGFDSSPKGSFIDSFPTLESLPFAELLIPTATKHGISPELVAAVVKAESGFNPMAQSKAGAKGLMQLMDGTARSLGVLNVFDPSQNLDGGTRFLGSLLKRYNGDARLALAAYNAGPGAVDQYGGIPPYQETMSYVTKVMDYWKLFGGGSSPLLRLK